MKEYKVLTVWQPWATLLVYGIKKNETRPKPTSWTAEKGVYLIHAAQKWTLEQVRICLTEPFKSELRKHGFFIKIYAGNRKIETNLPLGQIIGSIEVTKCCNIFSKTENMAQIDTIGDIEIIVDPELSFGDYQEGRYAWLTQNPRILKEPIPYNGGQGYYQKFRGDESQLIFKS